MENAYTNAVAKRRVEGDNIGVASQTGPKLSEDLSNKVNTLQALQDVREPSLVADVGDDDISPDDAPEIMFDGDDREVRGSASRHTMGHYTYHL